MSVSTKFALTNPEHTNLTMNVTMTLAEWKALRVILDLSPQPSGQPAWPLRQQIYALINFAEKHFEQIEDVSN